MRGTIKGGGRKPITIKVPADRLNDLQVASIEELLDEAVGMHYATITMRKGGKDLYFEADWLKHARITGGLRR